MMLGTRRLALALFVLLLSLAPAAAQKAHFHGTVTDNTGRPVASAGVTVYLQGTMTKATLYSTRAGAAGSNPDAADTRGNYDFYIDPGTYDIWFDKNTVVVGQIFDVDILDPAGGGAAPPFATPYTDVRDYGADCDGTTNDTSAIQSAVTAVKAAGRGTLVFPEGVCRFCANGLFSVGSNADIRFMGQGRDATILKATDACASVTRVVNGIGDRIEISDMTLDGNYGTTPFTTGYAIDGASCDDCKFHDLKITGWPNSAIRITGSDGDSNRIAVERVWVEDVGGIGIDMADCHGCKVLNNDIVTTGNHAIRMIDGATVTDYATDCLVAGNHVDRSATPTEFTPVTSKQNPTTFDTADAYNVLSDETWSGTYSGALTRAYYVEIDAAGAPDTFKWSVDGGATYEATGVSVSASPTLLDNGISIAWAATTGHAVGDRWTTVVSEGQSGTFIDVRGTGNRILANILKDNRAAISDGIGGGSPTTDCDTVACFIQERNIIADNVVEYAGLFGIDCSPNSVCSNNYVYRSGTTGINVSNMDNNPDTWGSLSVIGNQVRDPNETYNLFSVRGIGIGMGGDAAQESVVLQANTVEDTRGRMGRGIQLLLNDTTTAQSMNIKDNVVKGSDPHLNAIYISIEDSTSVDSIYLTGNDTLGAPQHGVYLNVNSTASVDDLFAIHNDFAAATASSIRIISGSEARIGYLEIASNSMNAASPTSGIAALSSGSVTVSTTAAHQGQQVMLVHVGAKTANSGQLYQEAISPGASFVIRSTNPFDDDNVYWEMVK